MRKNVIRTSITLYGEVQLDAAKWLEWFDYTKRLNDEIGYNPNYVGISGKSFKSGSILTIAKAEKRFKKAVEAGEYFDSLDVYSLPEEFKQAAFDYQTYMVRYCSYEPHHVTITLNQEDYSKIDEDKVIEDLKKFIKFSEGQIFEMSSTESPFFYASKVNPASYYKTLKILRKF